MFLGQQYSVPPAPRSLNRGAFLPEGLEYQDIRQWLALLTIAYCQCLQYWAEKHTPPIRKDFCPIAESVKELSQAVSEFVKVTKKDIFEGLEMEEPAGDYRSSSSTILSQVLNPLAEKQEAMQPTSEISLPTRGIRPRGRSHPSIHVIPVRPLIHLPRASSLPAFPSPAGTLAPRQLPTPPQGFVGVVACLTTPEPVTVNRGTSIEAVSMGLASAPGMSSMSASRIVQDNATGSVYLDTITTSIGRVVLSRPGLDASSLGPTIKDVTGQE